MKKIIGLSLLVFLVVLSGCRGYRSEKAPFHLNPNMDFQAKYKAQTLSMMPPEATVAWGANSNSATNNARPQALKEDPVFYRGKTESGAWVKSIPVPVTKTFILRGQERFDIYCSVCHDRTGSGQGMVVKRGFLPPPQLWDPRVMAYTDGELFDVISRGIRNMPGYGKQVPEKDRWAIVAYVRAIQRAHTATIADVPEHNRSEIK